MKIYQIILLFLILINYCKTVEVNEIVDLPEPVKTGGMPLNEALNKRRTQRDFDGSKKLSMELLSQALWSCYGINRPTDEGRTVPSAVAWYPLIVYVFLEDGVYQYSPKNHHLLKVLDGDHRAITGTQPFVKDAGADFVFIADFNKKSSMDGDDEHKRRSIYLDTGHLGMSLYLFAASNGLKGVNRAMVDDAAVLDLLELNKKDYILTLTFSLGY